MSVYFNPDSLVNAPDGVCNSNCLACDYCSISSNVAQCVYILANYERRPCPAGNGCTARKVNGELSLIPYRGEKEFSSPQDVIRNCISREDYLLYQSDRLRTWRLKHGHNIAGAARVVCVSPQTWSDWENGRCVAGQEYMDAIGINIAKEVTGNDC